jgi:hypothetical protein
MFEYKTTKRFDKEFKRFRKHDKETTAKIKILMADTLEHPTYGLGHGTATASGRKRMVAAHRQKEPPAVFH